MARLKRWLVWGGAAVVLLCMAGLAGRNRTKDATPPPAAAAATRPPAPPSLIVPTPAQKDTPQPAATQSPEDRYITIAQGSAMPNIRRGMGMEDGPWSAKVMNLGAGPELELRVPLNPATSNSQFVRLAKQNLAQIINALFLADPQLARIAAIGTFPDQAGESPAVSIIVLRSASGDWGTVTAEQLDALAEKVDVKPEYR